MTPIRPADITTPGSACIRDVMSMFFVTETAVDMEIAGLTLGWYSLRKRREGDGDEGYGIGICTIAMLAELKVVDLCRLRFGPSHFLVLDDVSWPECR
jgi:hypothetical protein